VIVNDLAKFFPVKYGLFGETKYVHAVEDVSFRIKRKRVLGLVGESGCGKTTTAKIILHLQRPTKGNVIFEGVNIFELNSAQLKAYRRRAQLIFQDPYSSLNPVHDVLRTLSYATRIHRETESREETIDEVHSLLETVGLVPVDEYIHKYPHELSGGERQRLVIARTLAVDPIFIVADEPISMLDMSMRADILKLLAKLQEERSLTYLYITHDLASARYFCDTTAIMYLGEIVEIGETEDVIQNPIHPYAELLLSAVPVPDPRLVMKRFDSRGGVPHPTDLPQGCRFHPRCPLAQPICKQEKPQLREVENRYVMCYFPDHEPAFPN